jgi:hypothetical protein
VRTNKVKKSNGALTGFEPLPGAHGTEPLEIGGKPVESGDELLVMQEERPPAAVRVVYVGTRRAWVRVALDIVGARAPSAEILLGPGTMVKRRD